MKQTKNLELLGNLRALEESSNLEFEHFNILNKLRNTLPKMTLSERAFLLGFVEAVSVREEVHNEIS